MRNKIFTGLFLILLCGVVSAYSQDGSFTFTTTPANINGVRAAIDHPALNNNPDALIFISKTTHTGLEHPIGVWYLAGKWYIVNRDQENMTAGTNFNISFWTKSDTARFVHIVGYKNLKTSVNGTAKSVSYIDHPALNNRPNAAFEITQSTSGFGNPNPVKGEYDYTLKRWYLTNDNGTAMLNLNRYNINVFNSGAVDGKESIENPDGLGSVKQNVANDMASKAGGDLNGNYPNPNVVGLQGRPLSNIQPKADDTLKWDGTQWKPTSEPQNMITATTPTTLTGSIPNLNQPTTVSQTDAMPAQQTNAMPAQQQVSASALKTYYQKGDLNNWSQQLGFNLSYNFAQLKHNIQVPVKSRLIISAMINITGPVCGLPPCFDGKGFFFTRVDGNMDENIAGFSKVFFTVGNLGLTSVTISNFVIDVPPGNHSIEFFAQHIDNTGAIKVKPAFSSVIVIPIE